MNYFALLSGFVILNIVLYPFYLGWRAYTTKKNPQVIKVSNKYYARFYEFGLGWRLIDNNAQSFWGIPSYPGDSVWRWCMHSTPEEAFACAEKFANRNRKPNQIKKVQIVKPVDKQQ